MIEVLDHGYVKLVDYMGSDERIIESARMSTNKGFLGWKMYNHWECPLCGYVRIMDEKTPGVFCPNLVCNQRVMFIDKKKSHNGDIGLLRTLFTKGHTTPFEMCVATFEVQAPIFVFREWHRHRTQSYSEFSARYAPMPDIPLYIPDASRLQMISATNKQAQGITGNGVSNAQADNFISDMEEFQIQVTKLYQNALKNGIPKELARLFIPVSQYSKMRASANLLNWIRFLRLRMPDDAQWEIRQYANVIYHELTKLFPRTMELFKEERHYVEEKKRQDEEIRQAHNRGEII